MQSLLLLTTKPPKGSSLHALLQDDKLVVEARRAGGACICRDAPDDLIRELQKGLGEAVLSKERRPSIMKHEAIAPCPSRVYDARVPAPNLKSVHPCFLVLRGLLADGILVECLKAQHRVTYGIPRGQYARDGRDLAVPFRASETPSLRADFVQPECQLVYTHLAHYQDGLPSQDVLRAVQELLNLGPTAQDVEFARWRDNIEAVSGCRIDCPRQFDIGNPTQLKDEIEPHFARNCAVIDFWLRVVVLPSQTQQFSEQRSKSAWDLVDTKSRTIGFAGTVCIGISTYPAANGGLCAIGYVASNYIF